jgi:signal transduction histidine kinase
MFNSLRSRLILSYLIVIAASLLFIGLALVIFLRSNGAIERSDVLRLTQAARAAVRGNPPPQDEAGLEQYALDAALESDVRVLFLDQAGQVRVDSAVSAGTAPSGDIQLINSFQENALNPNTRRGTFRDSERQVWVFVSRNAGPRGWQMVFALRRTSLLQFLSESLLLPLAEAALVGMALGIVMALLIARWVATPLQKLSASASAIAAGKFDQTAPVGGPAEVRSLAKSFNNMAARVKAGQLAQRDFVANVSHELKTPLTSIQGFSQAILDGVSANPDAIRRAATVINDEATRMHRLVEGLLDLARLDAGQTALHRAPTDLTAVLTSVAEKLSLRAAEKQVTLHTQIDPLPSMVADPDRLAQVFTNLLDNALKHTPAGGTVTMTAQLSGGGAVVTVTDTGSGIPAEDLPRIFERFYRLDKSRAAGRGYGLGLAITKEIVQAHGGAITAESVVGLGAKFTVKLPLAQGDDTTVVRRGRQGNR